jgi:hypothetical protein
MSTFIRTSTPIFLIAGFILFLFSCKDTPSDSGSAGAVKTPVKLIPVTFKPVVSTIDLTATTQFLNKDIVRAPAAGKIDNILIRQGESAGSGELLFTLRTREAVALGTLPGKDSTLSFNGLINITVNEPGVINSISYQKGDFVQEGDELAVISEQKSLAFIMDVPFEYQSIADKNHECDIYLPDGEKISGRITAKLPEMDMLSQTVRYIIKPSSKNKLPANLIARVRLISSSKNNAQVVPKEAVSGNETQDEFWVMKAINDSTAVRINIKKGYENNNEIEIIEPGFLESDRIILKGNYGLSDTAGISITTEQ